MGKRSFSHKTGDGIEPCPECQNRQQFVGRSQQFSEDCCDVWVVCACGFDPTAEDTGNRMEDVWGSLDADTLYAALENCWNQPLRERRTVTVPVRLPESVK